MIVWNRPEPPDDDPLRAFRRRNSEKRPPARDLDSGAWIYGVVVLFLIVVVMAFIFGYSDLSVVNESR